MGERTQTAKNTKDWYFFICFSTIPCQSRSSNKIIRIGHATACSTLIFPCNYNINHSLTYPKICRKRPKRLTILKKMIIFITEHFFLPTSPIKVKKTIGHATKCDILIVLCNSNISHSFICPKTWGKRLKRIKTLKDDHFS